MIAQYFGISGATNTAAWTGAGNGLNAAVSFIPAGIVNFSDRGMISSYNFQQIRDCTDGTSNTLMVGEVSTTIKDSSNVDKDARPGPNYGWWLGNYSSLAGATSWSNLVIAYSPNSASASLPGVNPSVFFGQLNTPLASDHTGGAHVLLTDGAVRFISNNIDINTLKYLGARDDGQIIGEF